MTIITKPSSIVKGENNEVTLTKADLLLDPKVAASTYYSNPSNWNKVILTYQSASSNQLNDVVFDGTLTSPVGNFNPSDKAIDGDWQIKSITITDFDNGCLKINRGDLTVAEFDLVVGAVAPIGDFWNIAGIVGPDTYVALSNNGIEKTAGGDNYGSVAFTDSPLAPANSDGGMTVVFTDLIFANKNVVVGLGLGTETSYSQFPYDFYVSTSAIESLTGGNSGLPIANGDTLTLKRQGTDVLCIKNIATTAQTIFTWSSVNTSVDLYGCIAIYSEGGGFSEISLA